METAPGPVCEFTYSVGREFADDFDAWLAKHADELLQQAGVSGAEVYRLDDDSAGNARRVAHVVFRGEADLEHFLAAGGDGGLGDTGLADVVNTARRVLRHTATGEGDARPVERCLNCGTILGGQYCGDCGQRATSRLISVWELLRDAFGDLLEFDSRLWRTLIPLVVRPGALTRDYLEGRRARYMPPFRTYLVLSIVFFLVAFFDPREELGILFAPPTETAAEQAPAGDPQGGPAGDRAVVAGADAPASGEDPDDPSGQLTISFSSEGDGGTNCDVDEIDTADWPTWLSSRLTRDRLLAVCDRVIADDGRAFWRKLLDNVPAALFLLLPLMALVLKVLYPLSKRYYVEHLLFVVHYHAFVFLILSVQVLFARFAAFVRVPEGPVDLTTVAVSLFVPVYLYKAQRRVYGQGGFVTSMKFLVLMLAYLAGLLLVFALVALIAAFSI